MALNFGNLFSITFGTNKEEIMSIPPCEFKTKTPNVDDVSYSEAALTITSSGPTTFVGIKLPQNATIIKAVVFGSDATDIWNFVRTNYSASVQDFLVAGENLNTENTSISNTLGLIDNNNFHYVISTSQPTNGDKIYGARITYTI